MLRRRQRWENSFADLFGMTDEIGQNVGDVFGVVQQVGEQDVQVGRQVLHVHAELPETDVGL